MNLTEKTAESAEGAGALDGAESGATLDVVETKASVVTPAATAPLGSHYESSMNPSGIH